jgi:hypothetical protein
MKSVLQISKDLRTCSTSFPGAQSASFSTLNSLQGRSKVQGSVSAEADANALACCVLSGFSRCLILSDPMDCSPPGSTVHGIFLAGILQWVARPSSRGSSLPRIKPTSLAAVDEIYHSVYSQ